MIICALSLFEAFDRLSALITNDVTRPEPVEGRLDRLREHDHLRR